MHSMFLRINTLLFPALAVLGLLLSTACGGAKASYPGPEPISLVVEEPGEGVVLSAPGFTVRGQVSKADAFVACQGRPVTVDAQGRFTAAITLQEGSNEVLFQAWRAADVGKGRASGLLPPQDKVAAQVTRRVRYERGPLLLTVARPQEGESFSVADISVQGLVSEADATVELKGSALTVGAHGAFQGMTTLKEGNNVLVFTAKGTGNRSAEVRRNVSFHAGNTSTVTIRIASPAEGLLTNAATLDVTGTVNPATATATLNGQALAVASDGSWSLRISPPEGPQTLTSQATDALGNTGQDLRHITVDRTPPVITLTRPVPALVNQPTLALEGLVDDPTALLTLQGQGLALDAQGRFTAAYGLSQGPNALAFVAVDPAGNVGTLKVGTTFQPLPPVVRFDSPMDGAASADAFIEYTGHVDDATAAVVVAGQAVSVDAEGRFKGQFPASREGAAKLTTVATNGYGLTGQDTRYVIFEFQPPALAWADPTPAQGAALVDPRIPATVTVDRPALVSINGLSAPLEPNDLPNGAVGTPFKAGVELDVQEGQVVLSATAVGRSGHTASIQRTLEVGLTAPKIFVDQPLLDAQGHHRTALPGLTMTGRVTAPDFVKPLLLMVNGQNVPLDADGRFSLPLTLAVGDTAQAFLATNRFGQTGALSAVITRVEDPLLPGDQPTVVIEWPLEGFASTSASQEVRGRVNPALSLTLNGQAIDVEPQTRRFTGVVTLTPGPNRIEAIGQDAQGRTAKAAVNGSFLSPGAATYTWDLPLAGTTFTTRTVPITGRADQPGIVSVSVNGTPMTLAGGAFTGNVILANKGANTLVLEARTLRSETLTERREVFYQPAMPRIRLLAPEGARAGDQISLQVLPEAGTQLKNAVITWNGGTLPLVEAPFPAQIVLVPGDAPVGARLPVEAIGTDLDGEKVTARAQVVVYGSGALLVEAFDDRTGLSLTNGEVALDSGERVVLDATGRAALATALPQNWIKVQKTGHVPVWRSAGLKVSGVEAVVDARLTPLAAAQDAPAGASRLNFAGGALSLDLDLSSAGQVSATPLSGQGLPALLPLGWSPLSAWWISANGQATLKLPEGTLLPAGQALAWVQWDESLHAWQVLATPASGALAALPVPASGGYALVLMDGGLTAPPAPVIGQALLPFLGESWREGLKASTGDGPMVLSTVEAIKGLRVSAPLFLGFAGGAPLPSGIILQADVLESYTLLDKNVIEPERRTQDAAAHAWLLTVDGQGNPGLTQVHDGLGLALPVRMSRSFRAEELVEGQIMVGFYHDGIQVAPSGSVLMGSTGGILSRDGVKVQFGNGAFAASTLVRLSVDPSADSAPWPELAGQGLAKTFHLDIVGTLLQGLDLEIADLGTVPVGLKPILVHRGEASGVRVAVAVGAFENQGGTWRLALPSGGNPILEGGALAVIVPTKLWSWVSGQTTVPSSVLAGWRAQVKSSVLSSSLHVSPTAKPLSSHAVLGLPAV